jgi:hypothetical protein
MPPPNYEGVKPGKLDMDLVKRKIWTADDMSSWALTRQRGRRHFIITRGVLLRGLPLGLCFFALQVWLVEPRDVLLAFMNVPGRTLRRRSMSAARTADFWPARKARTSMVMRRGVRPGLRRRSKPRPLPRTMLKTPIHPDRKTT